MEIDRTYRENALIWGESSAIVGLWLENFPTSHEVDDNDITEILRWLRSLGFQYFTTCNNTAIVTRIEKFWSPVSSILAYWIKLRYTRRKIWEDIIACQAIDSAMWRDLSAKINIINQCLECGNNYTAIVKSNTSFTDSLKTKGAPDAVQKNLNKKCVQRRINGASLQLF